ncbi:hypothetical protein AOR13_500 [Alteromonas stellipolaris LMG 21856]|nr:hypothetical protein AOR13_500 [Alteromonas stellipolaris LMG 21856]
MPLSGIRRRYASEGLVVKTPQVFAFENLNDALRYSKEAKQKAVVTVT